MTERISFGEYMRRVMGEAEKEWQERELEARYYRRMHLNNLIGRAEFMEQKGEHLEERVTQQSLKVSIAEIASTMTVTTESRHRMAKEIAEELIAEKGEEAHFYCVEKLANNTSAPRLWRDVLSYIDELTGEKK